MLTAILATALLAAGGSSQDLPASTDSHGAFGFPNTTGAEIIVLHDLQHADLLRRAICGGRSLPIRFLRRQEWNGATSHVPREFDRLEGTVFGVLGQRADPRDTCFVAADSMLEGSELLGVRTSSTPAECATEEHRRFAGLRKRRMKACWSLAAVQPQGFIGVVEYERAGRDALASLIVVSNEGGIVIDFPAEYKADGVDLWRADDGGEFSPHGFTVPFIIRRGGTYFVPVDWSGSEGVSLSLFVSDTRAPARQVISDYWYRAAR